MAWMSGAMESERGFLSSMLDGGDHCPCCEHANPAFDGRKRDEILKIFPLLGRISVNGGTGIGILADSLASVGSL
ncbi:MAG: hypothetical protein Q9215_004922 [Flavoplaca cf. flavocitrina]